MEQVGLAVALATSDDPARLPLRAAERKALDARSAPVPDLTLLVCCHAARDVRCAMAGPPLAAALQRLLRQRGLAGTVQVLATSHIGGHKYAGNVVCYGAVHPCDGDWFGGVSAANAADFLDALLAVEVRRRLGSLPAAAEWPRAHQPTPGVSRVLPCCQGKLCYALAAPPGLQLGVDGGAEDAALRPFWRGRMGLAKAEQLELFVQVGQ